MADRELKIKTGVVSRLAKELLSYKEELEENIKQTDAVRASSDHSKLKQWENVCAETRCMIPDTESRLKNAIEELQVMINDSKFAKSSQLDTAKTEMDKANGVLHQGGALANDQ